MNDKAYRLDTTFRTDECKNKRIIEWISIKEKEYPKNGQRVLVKLENNDIALGHFNECFIPENTKLLGLRITHWADISNLKPDE